MEELLRSCPTVNQETADVVLHFREGADIGFRGVRGGGLPRITNRHCSGNRGVSVAIQQELDSGSMRGPFRAPPLSGFVVNALSARDKANGAVRLILDLSQPAGESINAGIDPDEYRLSY